MPRYATRAEQEQHRHAVEALAEELHREVEEVQEVYERAYFALRPKARVLDYLSVLVTRQARSVLRGRSR